MAEVGRPTNYTPELGDLICAGISSGKSLRKICLEESMPCATSVYEWRRLHEEFTDNYARAREDAADVFAEGIIEIADDVDGESSTEIAKAKLRSENRKWIAARFNRAYQDKQTTEIEISDSVADRILRARERSASDSKK
jgi:hypothetical protein